MTPSQWIIVNWWNNTYIHIFCFVNYKHLFGFTSLLQTTINTFKTIKIKTNIIIRCYLQCFFVIWKKVESYEIDHRHPSKMGRPLLVFQGKNWKCKIYYRLPFESNIDKQTTCNEYRKNDVNVLRIILNCCPICIFPRYKEKRFFAADSMYAVNSTCKMIGVFSKMSCKI